MCPLHYGQVKEEKLLVILEGKLSSWQAPCLIDPEHLCIASSGLIDSG